MMVTRTIRQPLSDGGYGAVLCVLEADAEGVKLVTPEGRTIYAQSWEGFALQMLYSNPWWTLSPPAAE